MSNSHEQTSAGGSTIGGKALREHAMQELMALDTETHEPGLLLALTFELSDRLPEVASVSDLKAGIEGIVEDSQQNLNRRTGREMWSGSAPVDLDVLGEAIRQGLIAQTGMTFGNETASGLLQLYAASMAIQDQPDAS